MQCTGWYRSAKKKQKTKTRRKAVILASGYRSEGGQARRASNAVDSNGVDSNLGEIRGHGIIGIVLKKRYCRYCAALTNVVDITRRRS